MSGLGEAVDPIASEVLESLHEGCQVVGFDFRYLYVNAAVVAQSKLSREELIGRTMLECYPGIEQTPMFATLQRALEEREEQRMVNEFEYPDGSRGWFELRFVPVPKGACILSLDITERKKRERELAEMEEQLRQAQKMEAIGRLAGGVAHDFNNLLSVVLTCAELLYMDLPAEDPLRADVDEIRRAGQRATELTRQLLTFSRRRVLEPKVLDLNQVLEGSERMLGRLLGADIELTCLHEAAVGKIVADPGTLDQVLMNLAVNARDAMPEGGQLTIETRNVFLDDEYARLHLGAKAGAYVMLAVSDTGHGMDRETQQHVFEPFFTTKAQGKGTGLGLSTVFGIVKQNEGHIWLYSEPGVGTTFKIYFPEVQSVAERRPLVKAPESSRGNETILLVEDDQQVRHVAHVVLQRAGYQVLVASSAGEAFFLAEHHKGRIHLLLTDLVLPRVGGRELAERLTEQRPDLLVLFMSGYTDDGVTVHRLLESSAAYLQKPLTPRALRAKIREVLSGAEAPESEQASGAA
ncbi:MAG: response regulator [Myxococcales bacterium]|nr:response regulator [Myxococcales bacterium]